VVSVAIREPDPLGSVSSRAEIERGHRLQSPVRQKFAPHCNHCEIKQLPGPAMIKPEHLHHRIRRFVPPEMEPAINEAFDEPSLRF
jgi:hypothetical protein